MLPHCVPHHFIHIRIKNIYCSGKYKSCETSERKKCSFDLAYGEWNNASKSHRHSKERYQYDMSTVSGCNIQYRQKLYFAQHYPAVVEAIYPGTSGVHG
ncbi:hypothetical protein TNCV_3482101 [Trichonephila clavipes]|nr:hypothetical protein TNCV_3482101 [Trichonephila clavipes]